MKMRFVLCALLASLVACLATAAEPEVATSSKFCWPLNLAGVVAGTTVDAQVVRLLGAGAHRPREQDGVRYYLDSKRRATLRIATCTDAVVCEISLSEGVTQWLSAGEQRLAVSRYFDPLEGFGNWHALKLGATKAEVLANLGTPAKKEEDGAWVYEAACTCELPEYLTFHFQADRATLIVFSAPPG